MLTMKATIIIDKFKGGNKIKNGGGGGRIVNL